MENGAGTSAVSIKDLRKRGLKEKREKKVDTFIKSFQLKTSENED